MQLSVKNYCVPASVKIEDARMQFHSCVHSYRLPLRAMISLLTLIILRLSFTTTSTHLNEGEIWPVQTTGGVGIPRVPASTQAGEGGRPCHTDGGGPRKWGFVFCGRWQ